MQICPKCGNELSDSMVFCNYCGYKMKKNKKLNFIILAGVIVLIALFALLFFARIHPVMVSEEAFAQARMYEDQGEYRMAYEKYKNVIALDKQNYAAAQDRLGELEKIFEANKMAAIGSIILEEEGYIEQTSELSEIKANAEDYKMSCRINGIGFIVAKEDLGSSQYFKSVQAGIDDYYITEYRAEYVYNGAFTADLNWINQDISEANFKTQELFISGDLIDDEMVMDYVNEYYQTGTLPSFNDI